VATTVNRNGDTPEDLALTWSGRALDVGRIESELAKLRYMAVGEPASGEGFALRTSLLNVVAYTEHEEAGRFASSVIEELASHHPSRALVMIANASGDDSQIEAQLAAHCHISRTEEQSVCCEEVTLRVSGPAAKHLHSVIMPLLVPDLPVYTWWTEQIPQEVHLIRQLMQTSDRLIVDSDKMNDDLGSMLVLEHLTHLEPQCTVGDLNWDRLDAWRDLLEQHRNITDMRHHLAAVEGVEIRYAARRNDDRPGCAILFLAWLARRLGWDVASVTSEGNKRFTLRDGSGRTVSAYVHGVEVPTVEAGSLVSVKIACRSEGKGALLSISRTGDPYHLTVRTEHNDDVTEEGYRLDPQGVAALLMMELDAGPRDKEYNHILHAAVPLIKAARVQPPAAP
jgi:glucose-6-phosphate dehydrogenase assembly protein OpcA